MTASEKRPAVGADETLGKRNPLRWPSVRRALFQLVAVSALAFAGVAAIVMVAGDETPGCDVTHRDFVALKAVGAAALYGVYSGLRELRRHGLLPSWLELSAGGKGGES